MNENTNADEGERGRENSLATGESVVDDILDGERKSVFANKHLVDPNTIVDHDRIYGRDEQLAAEAKAFRDTLDGERPPDLLLYGPSGTGKSLTVKAVAEKVKERAMRKDIRFDYVAVNFKAMKSHSLDRAVWKLGHQTARKAGVAWDIPRKGVSTDAKYVRFYEIVDDHFDALVFILDEIDALTGRRGDDEPAYSELLYSLSRAMSEQHINTLISTVVITNHPPFKENFDSRTDSSYNPTDIHFPDYNANELIEILNLRRDAFVEDALADGVIELVSAYGAQNEGDARRAIDLLRDAGEIANRNGDQTVTEDHVHTANDSVKKNRVLEVVKGMTIQKKLALYAAATVAAVNDNKAPSPTVYATYQAICAQTGHDVYTQETVNSHINKAATYGVLDADRTSGGFKRGVHLLFSFTEPVDAVVETLEEDSAFDEIDTNEIRTAAARALSNS